MSIKPDIAEILGDLKDFQRKTVEYVYNRLYTDPDAVDRFLIADEVGLGKTHVAKGIVAKRIEEIRDRPGRIDIVYICANQDIARQNIARLDVTENQDAAFSSRMTLLPLHIRDLEQNKVNFVSFTPDTSLDLKSRDGMAIERAMIYQILKDGWGLGERKGPINLLQCDKSKENWDALVKNFGKNHRADPALSAAFLKALDRQNFRSRFEKAACKFQHHRKRSNISQANRKIRLATVGQLRAILAESCIDALKPSIIILDEFQRFKHLLKGDDEVCRLANMVFDVKEAKVLLLSATPYKMYTMNHERQEENHYEDFLETVKFLLNSAESTKSFENDLKAFRDRIIDIKKSAGDLFEAKQRVENRLRKVMTRTERISVSDDSSGMVAEVEANHAGLAPADLKSYVLADRTAALLKAHDLMEYWKSAPYLFNIMDRDGYKIKKALMEEMESMDLSALVEMFDDSADLLLSWKTIQNYRRIPSSNLKLRTLIEHKIDNGAWKLLWVPPSLPYYKADSGPYTDSGLSGFTKALVFSSWRFVPKAIAMLASYQAERKMELGFDSEARYRDKRRKRGQLLQFSIHTSEDKKRLAGMNVFPLIYPSLTLACKIDPLAICLSMNSESPVDVPLSDLIKVVAKKIESLLNPYLPKAAIGTGQTDANWYWAALALLDKRFYARHVEDWLRGGDREDFVAWTSMVKGADESDARFADHVEKFYGCFEGVETLGRPPENLFTVLAKAAIGSPAVAALRSLIRVCSPVDFTSDIGWLLASAAKAAMGFRSLFNLPDSVSLVRSLDSSRGEGGRYWKNVLDYCANGNLQAVMDEYAHALKEHLGLANKSPEKIASGISEELHEAVSLQTVTLTFDEFSADKGSNAIHTRQRRVRCRYALRFGDEKNEEMKDRTRKDQVRSAFNSPFRPFVLATTSVGQEGLDFHLYCHEIYHWNLPSNPVDLEQREGRIHRYKGHVIRKNISKSFPLSEMGKHMARFFDPWRCLFELARENKEKSKNDLVPFWIFELEDGHKVYRIVPAFPLSRENERLESLKKSMAAYRLVLGQPRQEDLMDYLRRRFDSRGDIEELLKLKIDLAPK